MIVGAAVQHFDVRLTASGRTWRSRPPRLRLLARASIVLACLFLSVGASAQDARSTYLMKLLQSSSQFRVRAQAAISLAAVESSPGVIQALTQALTDAHPAVRAAAATSLGRVGDQSAVPALRSVGRDPEEPVRMAAKASLAKLETEAQPSRMPTPVPAGPALYYVHVAVPASRVASIDTRALSQAREFIKQRVGELAGVALAPDAEPSHEAERVLKRRKLKGFYLDSSVVSVERKPDGATRVAVSVIVATYPGRDMRAIMQGAATVSGSSSDYEQALQGAFSGALRQLPQALNR